LTPLTVTDAESMLGILADSLLYRYTGESPPSGTELTERYRLLAAGSPDGLEEWANWIVRLRGAGEPIGYMQATVYRERAELAWLIGVPWQGCGFAKEAAGLVQSWLASSGTPSFAARIHPEHEASMAVARSIGLVPSGEVDGDGEMVWAGSAQDLRT
jgi:RimJ/RimL family protein N-acetyltransferase